MLLVLVFSGCLNQGSIVSVSQKTRKKTRKKGKKRAEYSHKQAALHTPAAPARRHRGYKLIVPVCAAACIAGTLILLNVFSPSPTTPSETEHATENVSPSLSLPPVTHFKNSPTDSADALKKECLDLASSLLQQFPKDIEPMILLGSVYRRFGNSTKAEECWKQALAQNPRHAEIHSNLGWIALEKGDYQTAIGHWEKAVDLNPDIADVYIDLAKAFMGLGRIDDAIRALKNEIARTPHSTMSHFLLGQQYLQQKHYKQAVECYRKTIALDPAQTNAYYGLATAYRHLRDMKKAAESLEKFKVLKQQDMEELKRQDKAFRDFTLVKEDAARNHADAAQIYFQNELPQHAESHLKRACALDPKAVRCRFALAEHYRSTHRLNEAVPLYSEVLAIQPGNTHCGLVLGTIHLQRKQYNEAERIFLTVIRHQPKQAEGYKQLAFTYLQSGRKPAEAFRLARKAVQYAPTAVNYDLLGWAAFANRKVSESLAALKEAMRLDPRNPKYKHRYAQVLKTAR